MDLSVFSERLSELIFDSKKVARDVAKDIGIGKTTIYEYLSGNKMPSLQNLIKIADYFNCSTDYILGLENEIYDTTFNECKSFHERFDKVLKAYGVTRYKLEKQTGIAESALYYWAKGKKLPTVESLITVCKTLDCRFDYLIGRTRTN